MIYPSGVTNRIQLSCCSTSASSSVPDITCFLKIQQKYLDVLVQELLQTHAAQSEYKALEALYKPASEICVEIFRVKAVICDDQQNFKKLRLSVRIIFCL